MQLVSSAENSSLDWRAQYTLHRGHRRRPRLHRRDHRLLLRHRRHARARRGVHAHASPATCWPSTCRRCARVNGTDSHAGLDPSFPADWRTAADDAVFQRRARTPSATGSTSTRGRARQGRRARARSASSPTTTRRSCTATTGMRGVREPRRSRRAKPPAAGRRRADLPQRLPRRAGGRDEEGGGPRRPVADRHRAAGLPPQRQPRPQHPAALGRLRRRLLDPALIRGVRLTEPQAEAARTAGSQPPS